MQTAGSGPRWDPPVSPDRFPGLSAGGYVTLIVRMDQDEWVKLEEAQLLELPIRKLGLSLEKSPLQPLVQQLYDELSARGLIFHPPCHVGDEWFVPVGIPAIYIPFFLVHERLRELERRMFLDVEGETPEWFMKLIRHEAGHAYSYAYNLYRRRKWQEAFGLASTEDTGFYRPRPYSRSYVVHLDDWYAQAHPDEDFAETFAVWLTPGLDWRARYRDWKALGKLEYVDSLMRSIAGVPPKHQPVYRPVDYDCLGLKLKTFYARKRKLYEDAYPDFYDADLRSIFPAPGASRDAILASAWLLGNKRQLMNVVCRWTNERKFRVDKLLQRLIERCRSLGLVVAPDDAHISMRVASYLTTQVMNYLFTGRFKRGK